MLNFLIFSRSPSRVRFEVGDLLRLLFQGITKLLHSLLMLRTSVGEILL